MQTNSILFVFGIILFALGLLILGSALHNIDYVYNIIKIKNDLSLQLPDKNIEITDTSAMGITMPIEDYWIPSMNMVYLSFTMSILGISLMIYSFMSRK